MGDDLLAVLGVEINPSGAKSGSKSVNTALKSMATRSKTVAASMRTSLNSVGGAILKLGALAGGLSVIFALKSIVSEFKDFEQGMKNVASVATATDEQLAKLSQTALDLARNTKFSPTEVTVGLYSLASAGLAVEEQMAALPNVLDLAAAAQSSLGQATEVTVALMNNFGLDASSTGRIVDVLTASIGASSQNMQRLALSLRNGGPAAAAFGQDLEESIAAMNLLVTSFGSGEKAGTGFAAILRLLNEKGDELGITYKTAAGDLLPLINIIENLEKKGVTATKVIEVLGAEGGISLSILLKQGSVALQEMTDKIQSTGQAAEVASSQMDTLSGDLDQMFSALDVFQIKLASGQAGLMRELVQETTEFINMLTDNLPKISAEFSILGTEWEKVIDLIGDGVNIILGAFEDLFTVDFGDKGFFSSLLDAFQELPVNAKAAFDIMTAHFWAFRNTNIQLMDILKIRLGGVWDSIEHLWLLMILEMKKLWAGFKDFVLESMAGLLDGLATAFSKIPLDSFQDWADDLMDATSALKDLAKNSDRVQKSIVALNKKRKEEVAIQDQIIAKIKSEIEQIKIRRDETIQASFDVLTAELDKQQAIRDTAAALIEMDEVLQEVIVTTKKWETETVASTFVVTEQMKVVVEEYAAMWEQMAEAQMAANEDMKKMWDSLLQHLDSGNIKPLLSEAIKTGFEEGIAAGIGILKEAFTSTEGGGKGGSVAGGIAGFADLASEFFISRQAGDGIIRSLANVILPIVAMAGPWGAAIAAVATLIDSISGGKLFGTSYEQVGSGFNLAIGPAGITGSQFTLEEKQKAFFGGTKQRLTVEELGNQIFSQVKLLFDAIEDAMLTTAQTLGVMIPEMITGAFEQEFDANGNVTRSISTVLGKTYEESFEDFAKRITAENILGVLSQLVGDIEVPAGFGQTPGQGFGRGGEFGFDFGQFGDDIAGATTMMNEVQAIAERWRHDAGLLLEGAQFLLLALVEIENGFNLLGSGSLTEIADITEKLNLTGETLGDTYIRLSFSTQILQSALSVLGVDLDLAAEAFVEFAADITNAAGGIEAASVLWGSFFTNYVTNAETTAFAIDAIADQIANLEDELGVDLDFSNFRNAFMEALSTLTPEEIVLWLKLGDALARGNDLAELFGGTLGTALENLSNVADDFALSQQSLSEQLNTNRLSINELTASWDDTLQSEQRLIDLVQQRYDLEFQMLQRVAAAIEQINNTIDNAIQSIQLSQLDEGGQFDFLTDKADFLASTIQFQTDPDAIARIVDEITNLTTAAFNLLDDAGQTSVADQFIAFFG